MKIIKVYDKERGYTLVNNHIFRDKDLSLKAKGLYCLMWSLPDDWRFSVEGLVSLSIDGKDAVRSALIELGNAGYMSRKPRRNEDGTLAGMDYAIYQTPLADYPTVEPLAGFPPTDKTTQLNTKEQTTNSVDNIELGEGVTGRARAKRFTPPTLSEVQAYCAERQNRVKPQSFIDFYTSKGWMVGKNPMKDWKAAVRTWEQHDNGSMAAAPQRVGNPVDYDV